MCNAPLIICLSLLLICKGSLHTGTFVPLQAIYEFTYTTTTNAANVNFQLFLTPLYSAALLIGKKMPFNVSVNRESWMHFEYLNQNNCDFQGMVIGRNQYAFARNNEIGSIIYMKLINFQPENTFNFTINITEGNSFLSNCPMGLIKQFSGQYCQFCDFGHIGAYCNITKHSINPSSQSSVVLNPNSYTYFILQTKAQISLSMNFGSGLFIFIQTQTFEGQIAGITNYLSPGLGQGKYVLMSSQSLSLDLPQTGSNYLVGVINQNGSTVGFSIQFSEKKQANIVLIIVGVIGGILFVGIIVVTFIIIRRLNKNRREIMPQGMVQERPRSNKLTSQEINFFFPEFAFQDFHPQIQMQASNAQLNEEKMVDADRVQCVICLCPIQNQQMARVCYCKHVFHSVCLSSWFRKQQVIGYTIQNCPYCRQNYERQPTKQFYNKLSSKMRKKLRGIQIVKSIFVKNDQMTLNTIEVTDISGETF